MPTLLPSASAAAAFVVSHATAYISIVEVIFPLIIVFVILAGAMLMPMIACVARLTGRVLGLVLRAALSEAMTWARLEILKWTLLALAALFGLGFAPAAFARSAPAKVEHESAAMAIERLMPIISRAANHPAAQVAGLALRGVTAYQLYVLRRDVVDVRQTTLAMLQDIATVITRVEHGELLNAAQWAEAHDRLDGHAARLRSLERRLDGVEDKVRAILLRLSWRACPSYQKHAGNACVDVRTLPE